MENGGSGEQDDKEEAWKPRQRHGDTKWSFTKLQKKVSKNANVG